MRLPVKLTLTLGLTTCLVFVAGVFSPVFAQDNEKSKKEIFADFDGDGINDNTPDDDGDGIPNPADPDYDADFEKETEKMQTGLINFGSDIQQAGLAADITTNSEKYGKREFCGRALSNNRCAFTSEEGFGSEGIGVGVAGGGGACAGGICR